MVSVSRARRIVIAAVGAAALAAAGCDLYDQSLPSKIDAGPDAAADAGGDGGADASADAAVEDAGLDGA